MDRLILLPLFAMFLLSCNTNISNISATSETTPESKMQGLADTSVKSDTLSILSSQVKNTTNENTSQPKKRRPRSGIPEVNEEFEKEKEHTLISQNEALIPN